MRGCLDTTPLVIATRSVTRSDTFDNRHKELAPVECHITHVQPVPLLYWVVWILTPVVIATRSVARPDTYNKRHEELAPSETVILLLRTFNLLVTEQQD